MEGDGLELAPIASLRDFWEITWGYQYVQVPFPSFWWDTGIRLRAAGLVSQTGIGFDNAIFKLKETPPSGANKE